MFGRYVQNETIDDNGKCQSIQFYAHHQGMNLGSLANCNKDVLFKTIFSAILIIELFRCKLIQDSINPMKTLRIIIKKI
jgi:hypothetical protein